MIEVTKRDGRREPLQLDKIHRVLTWAAEGLDVSISEIEVASALHFADGTRTDDVQQVLIKTCEGLATLREPDYLRVAARLGFFDIRKRAYGGFEPPTLMAHIKRLTAMNRYSGDLLATYDWGELMALDAHMDHDRDLNYPYAGYMEFATKYLVRDKRTGQLYESPQMLYMCVAMTLFMRDGVGEDRLRRVMEYYDLISTNSISLPTPIMASVRTPQKQFSSCVLIDMGDSIDSIGETTRAALRYISRKAGIGINIGPNRGANESVRNGEATNTGLFNYIKMLEYVINATNQGAIRKGSATVYFPWWHSESPEMIVLKNTKGTHENRAIGLDYGVQLNRLFYARAKDKRATLSLFSPRAVPGLYDAFFADQAEFERLYLAAEADPSIPRRTVNAYDFYAGEDGILTERVNTGRIYIQNVDRCNEQGPFIPAVAPIRMSNLCIEICLPTRPMGEDPLGLRDGDAARDEGEIALCTLSAKNMADVDVETAEGRARLRHACHYMIRALDNLLDYQDYPTVQSRRSTWMYRPLGCGVINGAYWMARNGVRYSDGSANQLVHDTFEAMHYYLLEASVDLAEERGAPQGYSNTRASQGVLTIDNYNRNVDELLPRGAALKMPWETLRKRVQQNGVRNATRMAFMPSETSSRIAGATNAFDPARAALMIKGNQDFSVKILVPEHEQLAGAYEYAYDMPDNRGLIDLYAIITKWTCQSISANTYGKPSRYADGQLPMGEVMRDQYRAYKYGVKTMYYHNTDDGQRDSHYTRARSEPAPSGTAEAVTAMLGVQPTPQGGFTLFYEERATGAVVDNSAEACPGGICNL